MLLFQVDEAVNISRNEPPLPPESLYCDIYHNTPPQYTFHTLLHRSLTAQSIHHELEASFQTQPFKLHRLDAGPSRDTILTKSDALEMYKQMQLIRRTEQSSDLLYKDRKVRGFCHLYAGQEACAVGIFAAKDPKDAIITSYRCHAFAMMERNVREVLSELLGRSHGNVKRKGGSMHMYAKNFYGGNGIVSAQIPLGAGIAFAMKYNRKPNLCFTLYGDGAANQGQLFEDNLQILGDIKSLEKTWRVRKIFHVHTVTFTSIDIISAANMCALWRLPCVFICENNDYGMGTPTSRSSASTKYFTRGDYIPGIWVNAMDALAVRESIKFARKYCVTDGKGPLFIEFATYRFYGHSVSDPGTSYRTREEVQEIRKTSDPILLLKDKILTSKLAMKDELRKIENQAKQEVDAAVKFAKNGPVISTDALLTDIYHNTPPIIVRGHTIDETKVQPYTRTSDII
uniref:Pyruvate dehydrogenase E1 component subunit alpha n=1 Tax=Elaeophora elaphi TaxID=1147741 RepID=A0A0R3RIA0_9BILA